MHLSQVYCADTRPLLSDTRGIGPPRILADPPTHLPAGYPEGGGGGVTEHLLKKNSPFSLYMVLEQKKVEELTQDHLSPV